MKDLNITNDSINIGNNISTNKSSSYEMELYEKENPLLFDDYGKKISSDNLNLKNNKNNSKKNCLSAQCFSNLKF